MKSYDIKGKLEKEKKIEANKNHNIEKWKI